MDSIAELAPQVSPKPLGSLGRDEMNLCEFPIALLTDRIPKDQQEAVYQDEIFDERTGRTLARRLTIKAGGYGLTTAVDDEVILALIQITKAKNGFSNPKVEFSRLELINMLAWPNAGTSYDRIEKALDRWTSVYLKYENAWRDNRTKKWTSPEGFHIIDNYKLYDSRTSGDQFELMTSYIVWNDVIFDSFQAGYLKPLDYDLCMGLRHSTAKRMYRFLDKRFHHKPDWTFDLKELAHDHVGMGRHYEGPSHLKRNLQPAIEELESVGFLQPLPESERFTKEGKNWKIRLIRKDASVSEPSPPRVAHGNSLLEMHLTSRKVSKKAAKSLATRFPEAFIQQQIEVFDWLVEIKDPRIAKSPAGYLVKSIEDEYEVPHGFIPPAERQRLKEAKEAKERQNAEAKRKQREQEARELAERQEIRAYWNALDPKAQTELNEAALASADHEKRALCTGPLKEMGLSLCRDAYIRVILEAEGKLPITS